MEGWIVRNLAGSREAYEQISFEKSILLLRPFGQPYGPDNLEWVQACTEAALKDHKAKKDKAREDWTPRIESIIDQVSPRLVGGSDPQILAGIRLGDSRVLLRIGSRDTKMEALRDFDDLLSAWERARKRLNERARKRLNDVRPSEPDEEEIEELSRLKKQLGTLEYELNRLNPRVVQMLREAVQIGAGEIERLKQASEAKKG